MKIFDISQPIFGCEVYPGDPSPERIALSTIDDGDFYNLTLFSMCAHNGTHIDAPSHFIKDGATVAEIDLSKVVGYAYLAKFNGEMSENDAKNILNQKQMLKPTLLLNSYKLRKKEKTPLLLPQ